MKEKERLQRIREWAVEEALYALSGDKYPQAGMIMTLAMLFEGYVVEGSKAKAVKMAMKRDV